MAGLQDSADLDEVPIWESCLPATPDYLIGGGCVAPQQWWHAIWVVSTPQHWLHDNIVAMPRMVDALYLGCKSNARHSSEQIQVLHACGRPSLLAARRLRLQCFMIVCGQGRMYPCIRVHMCASTHGCLCPHTVARLVRASPFSLGPAHWVVCLSVSAQQHHVVQVQRAHACLHLEPTCGLVAAVNASQHIQLNAYVFAVLGRIGKCVLHGVASSSLMYTLDAEHMVRLDLRTPSTRLES